MLQPRSIGIVPARGGSKGLPGKNIRPLAGKPLFRHAVDQGLSAGLDRIVITTDIPEIFDLDLGPAVVVHHRPADLCGDDVPMSAVLVEVLQWLAVDEARAVLLQATSPLRTPEAIRACVGVYESNDVDLAMTVTEADRGVLKYGTVHDGRFHALRDASHPFMNRQSLPAVYRPNGAVYVFDAGWVCRNGDLRTDSIAVYEMSAQDSIDIDTLEDFERCERALAARRKGRT